MRPLKKVRMGKIEINGPHVSNRNPPLKPYFWFHVRGVNGRILVTSEMYKTKRSALKGIAALRAVADWPVKDLTV